LIIKYFNFKIISFYSNSTVTTSLKRRPKSEEARRLARRYDEKFSVFQRMYVVVPKVVETRTLACDADALAGTLARQFQAANMHMSIESARAIVDRSLKEVIANGK
jgi:hypothetical protein